MWKEDWLGIPSVELQNLNKLISSYNMKNEYLLLACGFTW